MGDLCPVRRLLSDGCFLIGIRRSILAEGVSRYVRSTQCSASRVLPLPSGHGGLQDLFHHLSDVCNSQLTLTTLTDKAIHILETRQQPNNLGWQSSVF